MKFSGRTDKGLVRTANQDAFDILELSENAVCAIVCDGMGGAKAGNVASNVAVKTIAENIQNNFRLDMNSNSIRSMLFTSIGIANIKVFEMGNNNKEYEGMGTTAVVALVIDNNAYFAHVGDSRAYMLTNDSISQITRDHSIVQVLVERGELTETEAKSHPKKNLITRALGISANVDIDYTETTFNDGDTILICTDGLSNLVDNKDILSIVNSKGHDNCVDKLIETANERGGNDNITVVEIS